MQKKDTIRQPPRSARVISLTARREVKQKKKRRPALEDRREAKNEQATALLYIEDRFIEGCIDLNRSLMKHPVATFYVRVEGDSMIGAGINPGDILVVDRAVTARHGDIIIARVEDELYVKRLHIEHGETVLIPENPAYEPFRITEEMDFESGGTVMHVIHTFRREDD